MLTYSYNLSAHLKENLAKVENLRRMIILAPISPLTEKRMQWEATLQRTNWSFILQKKPISKSELVNIFSKVKLNKQSSETESAINYKKVFDYLYLNWLVTNKKVTSMAVRSIYKICSNKNSRSLSKNKEEEINFFLNYLQTGNVHPVVQAGIAEIHLLNLSPFSQDNEIVANFLGYLFLYKYGYDIRRLLVKEEFLYKDYVLLKRIRENININQNLTVWLENYSEGIYTQLAKAYQLVQESKFTVEISPLFWKLNKRQQEIYTFLQQPNKKISNKDVQKMFAVSQITASRDLSKLTSCDLVFAHGKGRSTYYTLV
jgi:hypothetical protein